MQKNKNLLTIVLTLRDRVLFTYRWMKWMDENQCPYKILIADGGKDKDIENHLKDSANYKNLDYEYHRYPEDENISMFFKKHEDIVSKVNTEYVVMQADNDDFFSINGINESIKFLEKNNDYVGCGGYAYYLILRDKENIKNINAHINGDKPEFFKEAYPQTCYFKETASDRVECFLTQSAESTAWYNVYKTDATKKVLKGIVKNDFVNFSLHERYVYLSYLSMGKIKLIDTPYIVRQSNTTSNNNLETRTKNILYLLLKDKEFYEGIHKTIHDISSLVCKTDNLNKNDYFSRIEDKIIEYYKRLIFCPACNDKKSYKNTLQDKFRNNILYKVVRTAYHSIDIFSKQNIFENLNKPSNKELKKIKQFLKEYKEK